jgi:hypothetical protein
MTVGTQVEMVMVLRRGPEEEAGTPEALLVLVELLE